MLNDDLLNNVLKELHDDLREILKKEVIFKCEKFNNNLGAYVESSSSVGKEKIIYIDPLIINKESLEILREVLFHEVGHFLRSYTNEVKAKNRTLFLKVQGFKRIYSKERKYYINRYYRSDIGEFFAESFCRYIIKDKKFADRKSVV